MTVPRVLDWKGETKICPADSLSGTGKLQEDHSGITAADPEFRQNELMKENPALAWTGVI